MAMLNNQIVMEYGHEKWHLNQFLGQSIGWIETNPN